MTTKPSDKLTLHDRLSQLDYVLACKLLGENGRKLIQSGGAKYEFLNLRDQIYFKGDLFRVRFDEGVVVTITLMAEDRQRLRWNCTACERACTHVGAAFSLILEEKTLLGLAEPPPERQPIESLREDELVELAIEDRRLRAKSERFRLVSNEPDQPWTDYTITSYASGKTYRLAMRGEEPGLSYCSCPDFRTNTLGYCKHILYAHGRIKAKFPAEVRAQGFRREELTVHVHYGDQIALRLGVPDKLSAKVRQIVEPLIDRDIEDVHDLLRRADQLEQIDAPLTIYPDAEELIQQRLFQDRVQTLVAEIRRDPAAHVLRRQLLKTELLPYQLDGIAFVVGAGRAVLADDMGLGKTIQGIGVAELLSQTAEIEKVLVICPTSLKSQWRSEVHKFSHRDCQLVVGSSEERARQYNNDAFFTICNYEQVLRDLTSIERVNWDLIILDEGQRIKNWEAKTSRLVKSLKSPFALVLSGTPLENRLDELYSVVQFVDDRRLGPAFRFFNRHRIVDETGKVLGYKNLDHLRENLRPILLRRTRAEVLDQLPPRTTEIVRIPPTEEQQGVHAAHMQIVASIVRKKFISEMDLLRLRRSLLACRMCADSTYLVTKEAPGYSSKLEYLEGLLQQLADEDGRKIVLFSEWTTMLSQIELILERLGLTFVRLDGSVPQKKRQSLVHEFQNDPDCQLFITTNAGSTGLNLQAANTVINVDLPWNPAVLEQRIARAHRMGQTQPVQVFVLVTDETLEENLLATLAGKQDLALAALDMNSDVREVDLVSNTEELKQRLEVLLGARADAPVDASQREEATEAEQPGGSSSESESGHRERVAAAGGEMLGAVFNFLGELVQQDRQAPAAAPEVVSSLRSHLNECVHEDESGRQRLTLTLPNREALDGLAETLARLLATRQ